MQHLYLTAEARRPVCADLELVHPVHPVPVCARCYSAVAHRLRDQIASLQDQVRQQDAEIYRLRTAGKPRL